MLKLLVPIAVLLASVLGGWLGLQQAKAAVRNVGDISSSFETSPGQWRFSDTVGSEAATPMERARIAIGGPLGLSATETIYFLTLEDSKGAKFSSTCEYQVSGGAFDARWWSITIYDGETQAYIANKDNRSSWNSVALAREAEGPWQFTIASKPPASGLWLPSQVEPSQSFELLLRLYNPSPQTRAKAPVLEMPRVEKISC